MFCFQNFQFRLSVRKHFLLYQEKLLKFQSEGQEFENLFKEYCFNLIQIQIGKNICDLETSYVHAGKNEESIYNFVTFLMN